MVKHFVITLATPVTSNQFYTFFTANEVPDNISEEALLLSVQNAFKEIIEKHKFIEVFSSPVIEYRGDVHYLNTQTATLITVRKIEEIKENK